MKPFQKVLMTSVWVLLVLAMVSVIGAQWWRQQKKSDLPLLGAAPPFELVDQDSQPTTNKTLLGKPWIANFVFTHCAGPCPVMTQKMAALQQQINSPHVRFVSFSVDPQRDTPAVLKEYGQRHGADQRWKFLTGNQDTIAATSKGMLLALDTGDGQPTSITHSTKFVLVDPEGNIRQYYDSTSQGQMAALVRDATALARESE
jgi:protein SCO1/2